MGLLVDGASQVLKVPVSVHRGGARGGGRDRRQLHPRRGQAGEAPDHPDGPAQGPGPRARPAKKGARMKYGEMRAGPRTGPLAWRCVVAGSGAWAAAAAARGRRRAQEQRDARPGARPSTRCAAWRPGTRCTEYDLRGDKAEADARGRARSRAGARSWWPWGRWRRRRRARRRPSCRSSSAWSRTRRARPAAGAPNIAGVAFAVPVKNQLAAFRMVNPRGRAGRRDLQRRATWAGSCRRRRRPAPSVRLALVAEGRSPPSATSPRRCARCSQGADAVDAVWIPPDPVLLGDGDAALHPARDAQGRQARLRLHGHAGGGGRAGQQRPRLRPRSASRSAELVNRLAAGEKGRMELLVPRAELVINKKIADEAEDRDPGRRAEGRQPGLLSKGERWKQAAGGGVDGPEHVSIRTKLLALVVGVALRWAPSPPSTRPGARASCCGADGEARPLHRRATWPTTASTAC